MWRLECEGGRGWRALSVAGQTPPHSPSHYSVWFPWQLDSHCRLLMVAQRLMYLCDGEGVKGCGWEGCGWEGWD